MTKELYALLRHSADVILILLQTGGPAQMHYGRTCTDALWEALHRCIKFLKKYYTHNMHILKTGFDIRNVMIPAVLQIQPFHPFLLNMCKYKRRYVNFLYLYFILNWISKFDLNQQIHWRHVIENIHTERRTGSNFIINIPSLHGAHHMFSLMFMTRNEFIKVSAVNKGLPCC